MQKMLTQEEVWLDLQFHLKIKSTVVAMVSKLANSTTILLIFFFYCSAPSTRQYNNSKTAAGIINRRRGLTNAFSSGKLNNNFFPRPYTNIGIFYSKFVKSWSR